MSTLLTARGLRRALPQRTLFDGVSIHLEEGDRLGLIGPNGGGKSTLLKMLAGFEESDGDGVVTRRRGLRVAYVPQEDRFDADATVRSAVLAGLADAVAAGSMPPIPEHERETKAAIVLTRLGFDDLDRPVAALSGGWRKRLALARGLSTEPDLLLLDEPTNHLDLEGVRWLERFVQSAAPAMVFVTHDRRFLEKTANRIVELSNAYADGTFEAKGNYSAFLRRREEFMDAEMAAQSSLANRVRRDDAWLKQGVQARRTRTQSTVDAAATRREALADSKERMAAPQRTASIDFQATDRRTRKLVTLEGVAKSMGGRRLFAGLELELSPGDRLGLLGPNGSGKTTLLRVIAGELAPDAGRVERAHALRIIVFSQHRAALDPAKTLQESLCPLGDHVDFRGKAIHVAAWAKRFLFEASQLPTPVRNLSGGEQARLLVANLMRERADVLLLDEPTNDLDIPSLEVLEEALLEFAGALVLVTHDRFMLERVATEFVGLLPDGTARRFASVEQWERALVATGDSASDRAASSKPEPEATAPSPDAAASSAAAKAGRRKLSYKDQREYDGMEAAILAAEQEVERLEAATRDPATLADHARAADAYARLAAATDRVKALYERWTELEAMQGG
jgi:ABC transport system ATP-binding/permease protein